MRRVADCGRRGDRRGGEEGRGGGGCLEVQSREGVKWLV